MNENNYIQTIGENSTLQDSIIENMYLKAFASISDVYKRQGYENVSDSVKADIFGFDIADVSGSIRLFSDVIKKLGIKLDGDELYEEFQRMYDESVDRDADKEKTGDKIWNNGRGR